VTNLQGNSLPQKLYTLGRDEIIRGFGSFEKILTAGRRFEIDCLTAFVDREIPASNGAISSGETGIITPVKVGFILSKKKLKRLTIETA